MGHPRWRGGEILSLTSTNAQQCHDVGSLTRRRRSLGSSDRRRACRVTGWWTRRWRRHQPVKLGKLLLDQLLMVVLELLQFWKRAREK